VKILLPLQAKIYKYRKMFIALEGFDGAGKSNANKVS